jgi:shikimate kinase
VTDPRVLLVGMMGVGKTTVGRAVAKRTGWPYVDNDELLHVDTGLYGADLLARDGEQALRDGESRVLAEILQRDPPLVAGVAAGCVLRAENRERMRRDGFVVWLRARLETLVDRLADTHGRAWLDTDPLTALGRLAEGRDPLYAEVASLTVDVDDIDPDAVAERIVALLNER